MPNVVVFPLARSPGFVRRVVDLLDQLPDQDAMTSEWRRRVVATLNRFEANGVDRRAADDELVRLLAVVNDRLGRRRADRHRAVAKRQERASLRLVQPAQGDLFLWAAKPTVAVRIEGDTDATAS